MHPELTYFMKLNYCVKLKLHNLKTLSLVKAAFGSRISPYKNELVLLKLLKFRLFLLDFVYHKFFIYFLDLYKFFEFNRRFRC
jgi:hypothetical protein